VVINKADIDEPAATRARAQITSALRLLGPHAHAHAEGQGTPSMPVQVLQLSALEGTGLDEFWQAVTRFRDRRAGSGALALRRRQQDRAWMWERIESGLHERFRRHPAVQAALPGITEDVNAGRLAASVAARRLLDLMD
jgi:LAO/AO transport system kinase